MKAEIDIFNLKYNNVEPKKGAILISEPFSNDVYFRRSIILLTEHNKLGSAGLILNKPTKHTLSDVFENFNYDKNICIGGPVKNENIYYLHTLGRAIPNSIKIKDGLFFGGDFEILKELIFSGNVSDNEIRFFAGYSGWDSNQLTDEIKKDFWLVSGIDNKTVMNYNKEIWQKVTSKLHEKYKLWANFPEIPSFN